jgi:DNA-binding PadR family transcriptional regulator
MPDGAPRITLQLLAVLNVLLEAPQAEWYGLDVAARAQLKTGTVYPLLARLERFGWLSSEEEGINPAEAGRPRRRLYRLTGAGAQAAQTALADSLRQFSPLAASQKAIPGTMLQPRRTTGWA